MSTSSTSKVWFGKLLTAWLMVSVTHKSLEVTGASSGLGRAVVEHALSQGDKVSATCRKPADLADLTSKWPSSQLVVLKLDVTLTSDIEFAFAKAVEAFGRVDIVYNNAGYSAVGEAEGTTEEIARPLYDVNFWGAINVSKEAVKVFREVNKPVGGVLLQASSVVGVSGHAGAAVYSSSYAFETHLCISTHAYFLTVNLPWKAGRRHSPRSSSRRGILASKSSSLGRSTRAASENRSSRFPYTQRTMPCRRITS